MYGSESRRLMGGWTLRKSQGFGGVGGSLTEGFRGVDLKIKLEVVVGSQNRI